MSFLVLLMLVITLFYLTFNSGFNCAETPVDGLCVLNEEYEAFSTLLIIEVGFIAVFLILASYFQQYFMIDNKKEKVKVKKEKKRYTSIKAPKPLEEYVSPDLLKKEEKPKVKSTPIGVHVDAEIKSKEALESKEEGTKPTPISQVKTVESEIAQSDLPLETKVITQEESIKEDPSQETITQEEVEEEKPTKTKKEKRFKIKAKRGMALYEAPSENTTQTPTPIVSETKDNVLVEAPVEKEDSLEPVPSQEDYLEEKLKSSSQEEMIEELIIQDKEEALTLDEEKAIEDQSPSSPVEPPVETLSQSRAAKKSSKKTSAPKPITDLEVKPIAKKRTLLEKTAKRRTKSHTKEDISLVLESLTGLSKEDSRLFLDTLINIMSDTLVKHDKIAIHQFGTFTCSKLKARKMQVPTKDEALTEIPAHYVVRFKGSPAFFDYLNDGTDLPITPPEEVVPTKKESRTKKAPKVTITKTKDDLIESILNQCEITPKEASLFMDTWINVMHETLEGEEKVALHQFGTFDITKHKEKKMVIPNTQEEKIVPAHNVIKFKPSKAFTDQLNTEKK